MNDLNIKEKKVMMRKNTFKLSLIAGLCLGAEVSVVNADRLIGVQQSLPSPVVAADEQGFGAWNLDNVNVRIVDVDSGLTVGKTYDETDGSYDPMVVGDTFVSDVTNQINGGTVMANLFGKNWPVGEPSGVKAITATNNNALDKPESCIMSTSYYSTDDGVTGWLDDTVSPNPTLCDSPFQTHKRFKVSALPPTVPGLTGTEEGIDLVFNVEDEVDASRRYLILQKLNNYTDKRLAGYTVELGFGVGASFVSAATEDVALSLGLAENTDGTDVTDPDDLAVFSAGLFGLADPPKHPTDGFFDNTRAGYNVVLSDQYNITTTTAFAPSNYTLLFGDWLPSIWEPSAIFYDDDNDPLTDATLVAFWGDDPDTVGVVDYQWLQGDADNFDPVPVADLITWATDTSGTGGNSLYSVGGIEDVLNLGLTYIVEVGDRTTFPAGNQTSFTVRMTPKVAADQTVPGWVTTTPTTLASYIPAAAAAAASGGGGGGCVADENGRFDPLLPTLLLTALAFLGFRRRTSDQTTH